MNAAQSDGGRRRFRPGRLLLTLAAMIAVIVGLAWFLARPATPDAFYTPPDALPDAPGMVVRSEPFTRGIPEDARAWRVLYTTTRKDGSPAVASAIVMASRRPAAGPRPVVAWAHGTTGMAPGCAPSLAAEPFRDAPGLPAATTAGWVVVATDYVGLGAKGGHAYLVGEEAARAVLDSVRAARRLPDLNLDRRTVVWGHSQGGHSALWTGMRARAYAPDLELAGVAAIAPASDLSTLFAEGQASMFGKLVSAYLTTAYAAAYPDVKMDAYVPVRARPLVRDIAGRCLGGKGVLFSVGELMLLPKAGVFERSPRLGPLGRRLAENTPRGPIPAPLLIAQGETDAAVLPHIQRGYVAERCADGQVVDFRTYPGRDHMGVIATDSPLQGELIAWTRDRIAGAPAAAACPRQGNSR